MKKTIIEKPWGYEEIWAQTEDYVGKILHINEGHRLSLQYHNEKEETIRVLSGVLEVMYSSSRRGRCPVLLLLPLRQECQDV
jgi:mannose-6-phosphate isomerase-like protein (cupin superfamily)